MKNREIIFNKYGGKCAYCGNKLRKGWHVDEFLPVKRIWKYKYDENNKRMLDKDCKPIKEHYMEHPERLNIDNQMPSCPSCNINKHSMNLEDFRGLISGFMNHLNEVNTQYKIAKRYGLIKEIMKPVVFYFETQHESKTINE